ncbi:HAD family hydrolase [Vibrio parahaemolyticus]|uniref:HAD family hydrolase n=1 Tax=Vibrio mediterranei TaxID=689 RepID=UPI004067B7FA
MSTPLYVFDMDETLFDADCAVLWHEFLVQTGRVSQPGFLEQDARLMALYADGHLDMEEYLNFCIAPLYGVPTDTVEQWVQQCIETKIMPRFFPQARTLLNTLKNDGVETMIISASASFLVHAIARHIGVDTAMGIDLVEKDGGYTSEIRGTPSYREGKVARLAQWLSHQPTLYTEIHFYTDSINDRSLCEFADHAYLVNPCPQLQILGEQKRWQQLHWSL